MFFFFSSVSGYSNTVLVLSSRVELLDYLDSIDCSLEDFQAMLSGRQFSIDPDLLVDVIFSVYFNISSNLVIHSRKYLCELLLFKMLKIVFCSSFQKGQL